MSYYNGYSNIKKYIITGLVLAAAVVFAVMVYHSEKVVIEQKIFTLEAGTPIDYADIISCNKDDIRVYVNSGFINTLKPGSYELDYEIKCHDSPYYLTVNLEVVDTSPPKLTVVKTEVPWMSDPKLLEDDYIKVIDFGDDKPEVEIIDGEVDSTKEGEYEITYRMTDRFGHSATQKVTYTVKENLPENCTEHERELYSKIQGEWVGGTYRPYRFKDYFFVPDDVDHLLTIDGNHFSFQNTNGTRFSGTYTVDESLTPKYIKEGSEKFLFAIELPEYIKIPRRLFCYENSEGYVRISDRYTATADDKCFSSFERLYSSNSPFKAAKTKPAKGMIKKEVLDSTWGEPKTINTLENAVFSCEQWLYSRTKYIIFEYGRVSEIIE